MTTRSLTLILPLCAALGGACGSDRGGPGILEPAAPVHVLAKLDVTPPISLLLPGTSQQLSLNAWDRFGVRMLERSAGEWATNTTYVSSAPDVAGVSKSGLVTAVAPGVARITASLTLASVTVTSWTTVKVDPFTATSVIVTAQPGGGWSPSTASVKAGGTVVWVIPDGAHPGTIYLDVWGPNAEKLEFTDGVAMRTFSTPGNFSYGTGGGLMWYEEGGRVQVY